MESDLKICPFMVIAASIAKTPAMYYCASSKCQLWNKDLETCVLCDISIIGATIESYVNSRY